MISGEIEEAGPDGSGCNKVLAFHSHPTRYSRGSTGHGQQSGYGRLMQSGGHGQVDGVCGNDTVVRELYPRTRFSQTNETSAVKAAPEAGSETVLLVDDDETIRTVLGGMLRTLGYQVLVAEDGVIGLHVADENRGEISLLLTDLMMPRMDGFELAARIWEESPETRVLYMSGCCDLDLETNRITSDNFLSKPFGLDEVAVKIRQVLGTA
jgi:CheY-like chemotaxis protein